MAEDPDTLVPLTSARTEFEGHTMVATLESEGIPAKVFAAGANMLQWEGGYTDPIKVMVRRQDLERAARALRANRQASVDLDWSQVDVGQPEDLIDTQLVCGTCGYDRSEVAAGEPCPQCGNIDPPAVRAVTVVRRPRTWRRTVRRVGFILIGAALVVAMMSPRVAIPVAIIAAVMIFAGGDSQAPRKGGATAGPGTGRHRE